MSMDPVPYGSGRFRLENSLTEDVKEAKLRLEQSLFYQRPLAEKSPRLSGNPKTELRAPFRRKAAGLYPIHDRIR